MIFHRNWLFLMLISELFSVVLVEQTLNLTDRSITKMKIKKTFRFIAFKISDLSIFIEKMDWLKRRIDHFLICIKNLFQTDVIKSNELILCPKFNYYFFSWSIWRWTIERKNIDMFVIWKFGHFELNSFRGKRDLVTTWFAYFTEIT